MAKKVWEGPVDFTTNWAGDESTENLPLSGERVQEIIKSEVNSKVGYLGEIKKASSSFYVLCRNEAVFKAYEVSVSDDLPFGDLSMDGVFGKFDAPVNYSMRVEFLEPQDGTYKSTLLGSTNNYISFRAETVDNSNAPQQEDVTVTYRIRNASGNETSQTVIYSYKNISNGVSYLLDDKLGVGENIITINIVGNNTGVATMRRVTWNVIDMYFIDRFDMTKKYSFNEGNVVNINVGYDLKGVGKTTIFFYFDGKLEKSVLMDNENPNISNASQDFYFTKSTEWATPGIHTLQMYMQCIDMESREEFYTQVYYREFIIDNTPAVLEVPYVLKTLDFDFVNENSIIPSNGLPQIKGVKKYENLILNYVAFYNAKKECKVVASIAYNGMEDNKVSEETLPLNSNGFSEMKKQTINLTEMGDAVVTLRAYVYGSESYTENKVNVKIDNSTMSITTSEEGVVLFLTAANRSNDSQNRDTWEYEYYDRTTGTQKVITTEFSKNEYVKVSTVNKDGTIVLPDGIEDNNCLEVESLPKTEVEDKDFLIYKGEYYAWNREFDWSNTSGWSDGKLKLVNGNQITINYQPFAVDKLEKLKEQGGTYEFEFETTNVYNENAAICRICGNNNFAPGISIYASGAELVISRDVVSDKDDTNAGYAKMVSTKYKAEEANRISFVISPDIKGNRNKILSIYVNGEYCGAYTYPEGQNFNNDSKIVFRASKSAGINLYSMKIYERALSSTEILDNFIYYRNDTTEKLAIYNKNDIMLAGDKEAFDPDKLKSTLPVMYFYQVFENEKIEDLHQEKKDKKLARHFHVVYIDTQHPDKNFLILYARITPQGTSSMNYPVKNFRIYTAKDSRTKLYVGDNIFLDNNPSNFAEENLNTECLKPKAKYSFKDKAAPVKCWCLKADFAESSSSHNTGTSRYWNEVLKNAGLKTKAQVKAEENNYKYDVRTAIDGFPIVLFYQSLTGKTSEFQGKYNFNNDKSTEDVFGFTGGDEIEDQEYVYYYIGNERPIIQYDDEKKKYACSFEEGGYTENPDEDSPLYVSDDEGRWYMLRGKELLDNPKMECWELLNSVNELALFKTAKGFTVGDGDEKVGIKLEGKDFDEAFESRYPDCGDYYHYNSLRRFAEWLVSCRYLDIDSETGLSKPFEILPTENYHLDSDGKLVIQSLSKPSGSVTLDFPGYNFYTEVNYEDIKTNILHEGYRAVDISSEVAGSIVAKPVDEIPSVKDEEYEYLLYQGKYYTWMPSNVLETDVLPSQQESAYKYVCVNGVYYEWSNVYDFKNFYEAQHVDDTAFNRALKFAVEKYDHIEMNKMAAYYIYLMRFGGVDQTVKNSMLTTEGTAAEDPNSTLPSLWYFINYDNDTILGVKNDGRLVFDPYITRQTKDGTGYVYAGRESTLWNNLEADVEFMAKVTEVDNLLAKSGSNPLYALSYSNALREYDTNQSDKWCERIYNKDTERKYIDTYVKGWVQKFDGTDTPDKHVYEDYLYDVQGSRSAHRKWWLSRRFNVFDSKFCNSNFKSQLIKFRSTNLPAKSTFKIKSGEPIFYAWGHDNVVSEMTKEALQPGTEYTFETPSAFNIGSYLEVLGSANLSSFDLRGCVGALTEIDVTGCYSATIGTKLQELLIGDHTRTDLINNGTDMKFSGIGSLSKLELLDITNIRNIVTIDGLNELMQIREVYAQGCKVPNFTFADGCSIKHVELPSMVNTLSLTRSSAIKYSDIIFEGGNYGSLLNLTINNCKQLMNDPTFVFEWIKSRTEEEHKLMNLTLNGIEWSFSDDYTKLFNLEYIKNTAMSSLNISGTIKITSPLSETDVTRLKNIFGKDCFKQGSIVYIEAPSNIFISHPERIYEGSGDVKLIVTAVGTTLGGKIRVQGNVIVVENGKRETISINNTDGKITMNTDNLDRGEIYVRVDENDKSYERLYVTITYDDINYEANIPLFKRYYPDTVTMITEGNSFNDKIEHMINLDYVPSNVNNQSLEGRGFFTVKWERLSGSLDYENKITLEPYGEYAIIGAYDGYDGLVTVKATVTRDWDNKLLCEATKTLEFTDPETILTRLSNEPLYELFVKHGLIVEQEGSDGVMFGKMNQTDARRLTISDFIDDKGKSIFQDNTAIESLMEFQYFTNTTIGKIPDPNNPNDIPMPKNFFAGCKGLKEISFSTNYFYLPEYAFSGCTSLAHVYGKERIINETTKEYDKLPFKYISKAAFVNCNKLERLEFSNNLSYIGDVALSGCTSLGTVDMPSTDMIELVYTQTTSPFAECPNVTFLGTDYDDSTTVARYRVKDGALYEYLNNSVTLIHMGKNTKLSQLITDTTVRAITHSMEYRNDTHAVVPSNYDLYGTYILHSSSGETLTINAQLNTTNASFCRSSLFKSIEFGEGTTVIPNYCCNTCTNLVDIKLPNSLTGITINAFQNCKSLKEFTYPENIVSVGAGVIADNTSLTTVYYYPNKPITENNIIDSCGWIDLYVKGDVYDKYLAVRPEYYPFMKLMNLPSKGHFNIIKDGEFVYLSDTDTITVGGLTPIQLENSYFEFTTDTFVDEFDIVYNGEKVGEYRSDYMTIYLGNNISLYDPTAKGIEFRKGIYDENLWNHLIVNNDDEWAYDERVGGILSGDIDDGQTTTMVLNPKTYAVDGKLRLVYGQLSENRYDYMYIHDGTVKTQPKNNTVPGSTGYEGLLYNGALTDGMDIEIELNVGNMEALYFTYTKDTGKSTFVDGFFIREIGHPRYVQPEYDEKASVSATIDLSIDKGYDIENVYGSKVTIANENGVNLTYIIDNKNINLRLPKNDTYTASFETIRNGYKTFMAPNPIEIIIGEEDINIDAIFTTTENGVYPVMADGTYDIQFSTSKNYRGIFYSSDNCDIYISKNLKSSKWLSDGETNANLVYTAENELDSKNINGYENSQMIKTVKSTKALAVNSTLNLSEITNKIQWFIPSYYELQTIFELPEVQEMWQKIGGENIKGKTLLTSNVSDVNNVWGYEFDGEFSQPMTVPNNIATKYVIFGFRK